MEKLIQHIKNLVKKKQNKGWELTGTLNKIEALRKQRQDRISQLAYEDTEVKSDRELQAVKRSLPTLQSNKEEQEDTLLAYDNAIKGKAEEIHKMLDKALEQKYQDADSEYKKNNEQHLAMLKKANIFGREKVTPMRYLKDRLSSNLSHFRSKRSQWTPEKLTEAIQNPELFLENVAVGEALGFGEQLDALKAKGLKSDAEAVAQMKKKREQNVAEREARASASLILAGKRKMPEHIRPYITDESSVDLIAKLLMTVENTTKENESENAEAVSIKMKERNIREN